MAGTAQQHEQQQQPDGTGPAVVPQLNKDEFAKVLHLKALRVPKERCQPLLKQLKGLIFQWPRLRSILEDPSPEGGPCSSHRLLLLHDGLSSLPDAQLLSHRVGDPPPPGALEAAQQQQEQQEQQQQEQQQQQRRRRRPGQSAAAPTSAKGAARGEQAEGGQLLTIGELMEQHNQEIRKQQQQQAVNGRDGSVAQEQQQQEVVGGGGGDDAQGQQQQQEVDGVRLVEHDLRVGYEYWPASHVLKELLPAGCEVPAAFETVGHIAHLNLRDELLPWRHIIGQVLLDKNPKLRTVVNKVGTIVNEYRVFSMEVLAGEAELETEVRQQGLRFRLDYSKVYWNSRLEQEHSRLVSLFAPGQVIADVMAGIGPFAVPAAKQRGCEVHANDLNPDSYRWLVENIRVNKVGSHVKAYNMDGRAFIRAVCGGGSGSSDGGGTDAATPSGTEQQQQQLAQQQAAADDCAAGGKAEAALISVTSQQQMAGAPPPPPPPQQQAQQLSGPLLFDHAVMNLPASAIEFVDAFNGAFDPDAWRGKQLPMVHCYTFKRASQTDTDIVFRLEGYLGGQLEEAPAVHLVRSVAPNKDMMCISFRLPQAVAFGGGSGGTSTDGQPKRQKVG